MNGIMSTDEMLDLISTIGKPQLLRLNSGWHAAVELPAPKGVNAKVGSDFGHSTYQSALIQLLERLGSIQGVGAKIEAALAGVGKPVALVDSR